MIEGAESQFRVAHILCGKNVSTCRRLGVKGYPTLTVLDKDHAYDYQGRLVIKDLISFVEKKMYLEKSRPRRIDVETTPWENLLRFKTAFSLSCWHAVIILFDKVGLGDLPDETKLHISIVSAIFPLVLLVILLIYDRMQIEKEKGKSKVKVN